VRVNVMSELTPYAGLGIASKNNFNQNKKAT
jgi:hypothetical protein